MLYFILRFYIVDFMSVLEVADDPDDVFNRDRSGMVRMLLSNGRLVRCYDIFHQNCPVNPLSTSSVELTTGHYNIV